VHEIKPLQSLRRCRSKANELIAFWGARVLARHRVASSQGLSRPFRNVLVIRLDAIGDGVLMTPFYRELKRNLPQGQVTVVVGPAVAKLIQNDPNIDRIVVSRPPRSSSFFVLRQVLEHRRLAKGELNSAFDLIVCPRFDKDERQAYVLAAMVDADSVVAYDNMPGYAKIFTHLLPVDRVTRHEVQRNLDILRSLGMTVDDTSLSLFPSEQDRLHAEEFLSKFPKESQKIVLGIGAAAASRRWPLERFAQVAELLAGRMDLVVLIVVGPGEEPYAAELTKLLSPPFGLVQGFTLLEAAALLHECDLFIGSDSGPAHIAAASHCPTLVISPHPMGGSPDHFNSPDRFAPFGARSKVVRPMNGMPGCEMGCTSLEAHCITQIGAEEVGAAALALLAEPTR
jgi:ADP-heptose:LPS heptosyltransferase